MKNYHTKSSPTHRFLWISVAILAIIVIVIAALELTNTTHIFHTSSSTGSPATTNGINYGPPTKAEKQDSEAHKKTIPSKTSDSSTQSPTQDQQNQNTDTSKQQVVVHITYIGQDSNGNVEENGFVEKIVENGGTCTLTLTKGSETQSSSRQGTANATNTTCGLITINRSKLSPGTWTAVLSYSSPNYTGESAAATLEVK